MQSGKSRKGAILYGRNYKPRVMFLQRRKLDEETKQMILNAHKEFSN